MSNYAPNGKVRQEYVVYLNGKSIGTLQNPFTFSMGAQFNDGAFTKITDDIFNSVMDMTGLLNFGTLAISLRLGDFAKSAMATMERFGEMKRTMEGFTKGTLYRKTGLSTRRSYDSPMYFEIDLQTRVWHDSFGDDLAGFMKRLSEMVYPKVGDASNISFIDDMRSKVAGQSASAMGSMISGIAGIMDLIPFDVVGQLQQATGVTTENGDALKAMGDAIKEPDIAVAPKPVSFRVAFLDHSNASTTYPALAKISNQMPCYVQNISVTLSESFVKEGCPMYIDLSVNLASLEKPTTNQINFSNSRVG